MRQILLSKTGEYNEAKAYLVLDGMARVSAVDFLYQERRKRNLHAKAWIDAAVVYATAEEFRKAGMTDSESSRWGWAGTEQKEAETMATKKAAKKSKKTSRKGGKVVKKGTGACAAIRAYVHKNPKASVEEVTKAVKKLTGTTPAEATVKTQSYRQRKEDGTLAPRGAAKKAKKKAKKTKKDKQIR